MILNILMATKKPIIWKFEILVNLSLTIVNVYAYLMSKKIKIENSKTQENRKFGFVSAQDQECNRLKYATVKSQLFMQQGCPIGP